MTKNEIFKQYIKTITKSVFKLINFPLDEDEINTIVNIVIFFIEVFKYSLISIIFLVSTINKIINILKKIITKYFYKILTFLFISLGTQFIDINIFSIFPLSIFSFTGNNIVYLYNYHFWKIIGILFLYSGIKIFLYKMRDIPSQEALRARI